MTRFGIRGAVRPVRRRGRSLVATARGTQFRPESRIELLVHRSLRGRQALTSKGKGSHIGPVGSGLDGGTNLLHSGRRCTIVASEAQTNHEGARSHHAMESRFYLSRKWKQGYFFVELLLLERSTVKIRARLCLRAADSSVWKRGSEEKVSLPLVAREAKSAFALTEPLTGSDAANVRTEAVLDAAGTLSFPSKPSPASKK